MCVCMCASIDVCVYTQACLFVSIFFLQQQKKSFVELTCWWGGLCLHDCVEFVWWQFSLCVVCWFTFIVFLGCIRIGAESIVQAWRDICFTLSCWPSPQSLVKDKQVTVLLPCAELSLKMVEKHETFSESISCKFPPENGNKHSASWICKFDFFFHKSKAPRFYLVWWWQPEVLCSVDACSLCDYFAAFEKGAKYIVLEQTVMQARQDLWFRFPPMKCGTPHWCATPHCAVHGDGQRSIPWPLGPNLCFFILPGFLCGFSFSSAIMLLIDLLLKYPGSMLLCVCVCCVCVCVKEGRIQYFTQDRSDLEQDRQQWMYEVTWDDHTWPV